MWDLIGLVVCWYRGTKLAWGLFSLCYVVIYLREIYRFGAVWTFVPGIVHYVRYWMHLNFFSGSDILDSLEQINQNTVNMLLKGVAKLLVFSFKQWKSLGNLGYKFTLIHIPDISEVLKNTAKNNQTCTFSSGTFSESNHSWTSLSFSNKAWK